MLLGFTLAATVFDDCDPNPRRQLVHRSWKIDVLIIHHEPENTAAYSAAKTVKSLPLRTDGKRRCFFLMKWTQRLKIRTGPFQRKITADDFYDVVVSGDLLDCLRGDSHFFARSSVLIMAS